jgi:hypothetical protein
MSKTQNNTILLVLPRAMRHEEVKISEPSFFHITNACMVSWLLKAFGARWTYKQFVRLLLEAILTGRKYKIRKVLR